MTPSARRRLWRSWLDGTPRPTADAPILLAWIIVAVVLTYLLAR